MGYESIFEALVSEFLSFVDSVEYIGYHLELIEKMANQLNVARVRYIIKIMKVLFR